MARIVNHSFEKTGAWFGENGRVVYAVSTGTDRQFDRTELTVRDGEVRILEQPNEGTSGQLRFVVRWSYGWGGKVDFTFRAYDREIPGAVPATASQLCSRLREHRGAWFGDSGRDSIRFNVPAGFQISNVSISVQNGNASVGNVTQVVGSGGTVNVAVDWEYGLYGLVRYFVCVQTIAVGLSASLANLVVSPNPAVAGGAITGTATITNNGSVLIGSIEISVFVRALTLEDVQQFILDSLEEDQRTQEVFGDSPLINLQPGQSSTRTIPLTIPETLPAPRNPSSAGTYRVILRVLTNGSELDSLILEPLTITKPPE